MVRQIPGPAEPTGFPWSASNISWTENLVTVESWETRSIQASPADEDGDGIQDAIDGQFVNEALTDETELFSQSFTDQHLGGVTFGTIDERSRLVIEVSDLNAPTKGVLLRASGGGEGTARLTACGQKLRLTAGDAATVTCGPLTLDVFSAASWEANLKPFVIRARLVCQ